jgi:hypothetical protein
MQSLAKTARATTATTAAAPATPSAGAAQPLIYSFTPVPGTPTSKTAGKLFCPFPLWLTSGANAVPAAARATPHRLVARRAHPHHRKLAARRHRA